MAPEIENELLGNVAYSRRSFVRKAVLGSAFAIPVVASFDMRSLQADASECLTPNQNYTQSDGTYGFKVIGSSKKHGIATIKVRVSDADTGKNVSRNGREVRLTKVSPKPKHVGLKVPKKYKFVNNKAHGRHYELKLNISEWPDGFYALYVSVDDDPNDFHVGLYTGDCA